MGKMKSVFTEDNLQQPIIRKHQHSKYQRRETALGTAFSAKKEVPPLDTILKQILVRVRRIWIALRFQGNRFTMGFFQERVALKLGTLTVASYLLFFSNLNNGLFAPIQMDETTQFGPVETALEVSEKKSGRSIDWNSKARPTKRPGNESANLGPDHNPPPMLPGQMRGQSVDHYISRFSKIAVQEMKKYGIPASISLAQGLVESRYGTSKLAVGNNNHFGMKCFSKKCPRGHCSNFFDDHHKDFFRKYKNPWESWRAHSQMLASGRYARLKKHGKNYKNWAYGLESLGYATDRSYAEKLIGVIQKYNLQRYDRM